MGLTPMQGIDVPYLIQDRDRHGNVRYYVRRPGFPKVRIKEVPGTPAFFAAYSAAMAPAAPPPKEDGAPVRLKAAIPGSMRWLCQRYFKECAKYHALDAQGRRTRKGILDNFCQSVDDKGRVNGDKSYAGLKPYHVEDLRDARLETPGAANNLVKALRQVFNWATRKRENGKPLMASNPALGIGRLSTNNPDGFHTWTVEELEQFEARWPIGTKPRLALALLLYVGVRRSDLVNLGKQMVRSGWIRFTETKGRNYIRKDREVPIIRDLQEVLDATSIGNLTFVMTEWGKPFTANGFGNWFRDRCNDAKLPQCSAHGLRKAGATMAAEAGATEYQLMAMYGWESPKVAAIYVKKARAKLLAGQGMHLIARRQREGEIVPLFQATVPPEKTA